MVTSKRGLNIPAGFDISLSKFGHFFHPGAKFLYKLPHPWEIPKISKQNNYLLYYLIILKNQINITNFTQFKSHPNYFK